jgi:Tol biopolymer transport system component
MSDRWLTELKEYSRVVPPADLERRIGDGISRPSRLPERRQGGHRFVVAAVALLLAAASISLLYRSFGGSRPQRQPLAEESVTNGKIAFASEGTIELVNPDGTGQTELRPGDLRNFDTQPVWSPDGTKIAFLHSAEGRFELLVFDSTSGQIAPIYGRGFDVDSPQWSPDGTRIAFVSGNDLYVGEANGGDPTKLTEGAFPAWSPDGTRIAFESRDGVSVIDTNGSNEMSLAQGTSPTWAPDGQRIAFIDASLNVSVMNADGTDVARLTNAQFDDVGPPQWSPGGTQIAFEALQRGNYDILVIDHDGTRLTDVTGDAGDENVPTWSPDGTKVAFIAGEAVIRNPGAASTFDLYVMNANGTNRTRLTAGALPRYALSWQSVGS